MKASVLVDSYGWIEYFAGGSLASRYAKYIENANNSEYVTPSIILYEVYTKIKLARGEDAALKALAYIIEHTMIVSIDKKIAMNAAEISLKTKLGMADAIVKAVAEEENAKLITSDEHFKGMQDVILIK